MHPNCAPGADMVLFIRSFAFVRLAQWIVVILAYGSLLPPMVRCTQWVSALVGQIVHSFLPYATFLWTGAAEKGVKKIESVPSGQPEIPWARQHRSLP